VSESAGLQQSGREYFKRVPDLFLCHFRHFLEKHVLNTWRSDDKLNYILGGHPVLAKSFAQMLVHYVDVVQDKPNDLISRYTFQNEDIVLGEHHKMMHERIKIKVCDAMCWLTLGASLEDIVSKHFVRTHWDMIKTYAEEEDIDIFIKHTWRSNPHPLATSIWQWIGPHAHHHQVCENGVQAAANVARTLVGQERRSSRVVIVFQIIFDGHQQAFFVKQGRNRNGILLDNIDYHMTLINVVGSKTESDEYNRILTYFSNSANKSSAVEQNDHQVAFQ
jgi:hypothetical protein